MITDAKETAVRAAIANPNAAPTDTAREVVETLVFVVVLVLLLKSFAAEAFVIPTGSMAQSLWGYQKVIDCPQCGYAFPVNCSSEADPQDGARRLPVEGCTCPNCRYHIDFRQEAETNRSWSTPGWNSGDRVLVAKFVYDLLDNDPNRLDVVVFKYPGDRDFPRTGPYKEQVPMNYIKRLIGKPGEIIASRDGNLYYMPADQVPEEEKRLFATDPEKAAKDSAPPQFWQSPFTHSKTGNEALQFFNDHRDRFQMIRKSPETMLVMRRIVYDNDHSARDLTDPQWRRWLGSEGWNEKAKEFSHSSSSGDQIDWLRYRHLIRGNFKPQLITDFMGYNTWVAGNHTMPPGENWVGDLMLDCDAAVDKVEGSLVLELSRGIDRFQARFDLPTGKCTLVRISGGVEQELESQPTALKKTGNYHLRFANFDERLTVWVDNELPFHDGVVYP
ncbi:MAG: S26 family signal peptidase, partial [Candidatus Acidiferrum sp.]